MTTTVTDPRIDHVFNDKKLHGLSFRIRTLTIVLNFHKELAAIGIGIHHAGLSMSDRHAVEDLYLKFVLKVVVATSVSACSTPLLSPTIF